MYFPREFRLVGREFSTAKSSESRFGGLAQRKPRQDASAAGGKPPITSKLVGQEVENGITGCGKRN